MDKETNFSIQDVVVHHVDANQNLWKIIVLLLKDVQDLKTKFKEIEEIETKSV